MLVFQRLFMAAFVVALTTLNLFAEGEPKMPIEFRSITEKGGGHG